MHNVVGVITRFPLRAKNIVHRIHRSWTYPVWDAKCFGPQGKVFALNCFYLCAMKRCSRMVESKQIAKVQM